MAKKEEDQLRDLGVETGVPDNTDPVAPRIGFKEFKLSEKPKSDVKIRLDNGVVLRERMISQPVESGFNITISNALLDENDKVVKDGDGHRIVPPDARHELRLEGVAVGRMTDAELKNAIRHAREIAAAKAVDFFNGVDRAKSLLGDRIL